MSAPMVTGERPKIDPFKEAINHDHFEFFESLHHHVQLPIVAGIPITKFHLLLLLAATIVGVSLIWLGRKMASGDTPRGLLWNALESLVMFVRDKIARPGVGEHDGDKYVPFLTTMFMLVFVTNLLGMIPFLGSATASIAVTFGLALISFLVIHLSGVAEMGAFGYLKSFVPHIHLEGGFAMKALGLLLTIGMAALEYLTAFIRLAVLSIRLFANMLAGHTALFMILFFIQFVSRPLHEGGYVEAPGWLYYFVTPFSVVLVIALSLLELLVAALQAFVFTLLTSIFIGLAKHPAH